MKTLLTALLFLVPFSQYAQDKYAACTELRGSGRIVREIRRVSVFDGIDIEPFPARILVESGATESSVTISIDDNLQALFQVEDNKGTLRLSLKYPHNRPFWVSQSSIDVVIRTPALHRFKHGSNREVTISGQRDQSFAFVNKGNGRVWLRGRVSTLELVSSATSPIAIRALLATSAHGQTQLGTTSRVNANGDNAVQASTADGINGLN